MTMCFAVAEVLELPADALQACIRAGLLAVERHRSRGRLQLIMGGNLAAEERATAQEDEI